VSSVQSQRFREPQVQRAIPPKIDKDQIIPVPSNAILYRDTTQMPQIGKLEAKMLSLEKRIEKLEDEVQSLKRWKQLMERKSNE